ncbi:MAG: Uma2 family endonuclease, partial [Cyanobacteria bacterium P01_D01_bin.1]
MVQAKPGQLVTFEDLLAYEDGTDRQYELTYGELVEVPPETYDNLYRARKLDEILRSFVGLYRVVTHGAAIATYGQPKNRFPDLMVLQPEHPAQMRELGRAAISLEMSPPMLIVEVVSPGAENRKRDYVDKRAQYERREVPEYWIIDPIQNQVVV